MDAPLVSEEFWLVVFFSSATGLAVNSQSNTPLTIYRHLAVRFFVSADGSANLRLFVVLASLSVLSFISTRLFGESARHSMAVCSRVLRYFGISFVLCGAVSDALLCHLLKWLLRQPYLSTNLYCGIIMLITFSSSKTSSACGGEDGFLLKWSVSAKCLPAIWHTLFEI